MRYGESEAIGDSGRIAARATKPVPTRTGNTTASAVVPFGPLSKGARAGAALETGVATRWDGMAPSSWRTARGGSGSHCTCGDESRW
jgi:hypothetical protein